MRRGEDFEKGQGGVEESGGERQRRQHNTINSGVYARGMRLALLNMSIFIPGNDLYDQLMFQTLCVAGGTVPSSLALGP